MLGLIICLVILALSIILFIKSKNYLNLIAAIILTFTIIYSYYSSTKKAYSVETKIEKNIEKNIEEKDSKIEVLGINMECSNCGRILWSDDEFCADCGYEKDISDFGKNARDYIIYNCPKCEKFTSSRRNFCSDCGENLTELNKMIDESISR